MFASVEIPQHRGIPPVLKTLSAILAIAIASVGDGNALAATYGYVANAPMIGSVTFAGSGQSWLTTTREYDLLDRLTNITSVSAGSAPAASAAYNYNLAQQRTKRTEADGSFWIYQYDALGQVTVGTRQWVDGTLVPGQQFEFTYDDIGNRRETRTGGDAYGSNLRVSTYAHTNRLNQVAQRTVPGFAELQGQANAAATVTVDVNPTERRGPFWRHELPVNNTGAVHQAFTIIGVLQGTGPNGTDIVSQQTGAVFVARSPQANGFDQAGRLTQDGQWDYHWDAEDRLIRMQSVSEVPASARQRIFFGYDHLGRRTEKVTYKWVNGNWSWVQTRQYLYDGWNLLAELDHYHDVVRTYGWGADLSGTLRGAGGVGGLVFVKQADGSAGFPAYDGNGNVTALYSATDGGELARYEHAPFGELLRASGPWASTNPFRFSTKYQDDETGLYYYGYRYYDPSVGRWLSRDPLEENGGLNLTAFVRNSPINRVDPIGLWEWSDFDPSNFLYVFESDFWTYNVFYSSPRECKIDPFSYRAQLNNEGITPSQLQDDTGRSFSGGQVVALMAGTVVSVLLSEMTSPVSKAGKLKKCEGTVVRYGCEAEAKATLKAQKLLPRPGHSGNPKWVGLPGSIDPRTLGKRENYTHEIQMKSKDKHRLIEWLKTNGKPKDNEPERWGIPENKLDEFNALIQEFTIKQR